MYHLVVNGEKLGPLSEAEVRERLARGVIRPNDLCWAEGWPEWRRVDAVFAAAPTGVPPELPSPAAATPVPTPVAPAAPPRRCGLATVSLVCGICTIVLIPLFFLFAIPAIVCGHVAQSRIKQAKGALLGGGMALAGLILGYLGVAMVPMVGLMAAMAIPAFQKVRSNSALATMNNDARQIAAAAQQYFLESGAQSVPFGYDAATGAVSGPLATYVPQLTKGYETVPERLTADEGFVLARAHPYMIRNYDANGRNLDDPPTRHH